MESFSNENDMGAYINKAELLKELSVIQDRPVRSAMQIIKILPTIDIVRCGECKHRDSEFCQIRESMYGIKDNDFCSYGERKE